MAVPVQDLPGDEPSDNQDNSNADESISTQGSSKNNNPALRNRLFRRNSPPPRGQINKNWFEPSDLGDLEQIENRSSSPKSKSEDNEDLPADTDYGNLKEDISKHYDDWQEIDDTELADVIQKGFDNLTDEEKAQRISNLSRYAQRRAEQEKQKKREEFNDYKNRKFFGLQIFIGYGLALLFMFFIVVFVSLFIYITIKEGTLTDNGVGVGILTTIQEVLKIIFSSNNAGNF